MIWFIIWYNIRSNEFMDKTLFVMWYNNITWYDNAYVPNITRYTNLL